MRALIKGLLIEVVTPFADCLVVLAMQCYAVFMPVTEPARKYAYKLLA